MAMEAVFFSVKAFEKSFLEQAQTLRDVQVSYLDTRLGPSTASLAYGKKIVSVFVTDCLDKNVLKSLKANGTELLALRSAGFNHVDLPAAQELGIQVARVPAYSPHAVAEHTLALMLGLNRKIHKAYNRVREGNFSLDGLMGFDLAGQTVGVIGTGRIGSIVAKILRAMGCDVLAYDIREDKACALAGIKYVPLEELCKRSRVISLHCPLNEKTKHLINGETIALMRNDAMLVNTSRGGLIDTKAMIVALKAGKIAALALDVYEEEEHLFFEDHSSQVIQDDVFTRLMTFPNVLITAHQGFFTSNALKNIAETTFQNIEEFFDKKPLTNAVRTS